jgi:hypothetical protein
MRHPQRRSMTMLVHAVPMPQLAAVSPVGAQHQADSAGVKLHEDNTGLLLCLPLV